MNRIAVVGSGIAGIACADALSAWADVTLLESASRLGGHTDTHQVLIDGVDAAIDSGFIVFNSRNYPLFSAWLDSLGVATHGTDMSFSVSDRSRGFEYGTAHFRALAAQPTNLVRPRFLRMLTDIGRFYRDARALSTAEAQLTLGQFCRQQGYGAGFVEDHLLPMCAALWSQPAAQVRDSAIGQIVAFMRNHGMLTLKHRPQWRVVSGGSQRYVDAFLRRYPGIVRTNARVRSVRRTRQGVELVTADAISSFDAVVLACHSDECLALLERPNDAERRALGAIRYQRNRVVVHTDASLMPHRRRAWSSWNAFVGNDADSACTVTYWMNRLQRIETPRPVFVSLNPGDRVRVDEILATRNYTHPVFDRAAVAAQRRLPALQGRGGVYFAGAWFGFGFHEDGFVSGCNAAAEVRHHMRGDRAA
jgi:predicted NAD/FAD-binding protein